MPLHDKNTQDCKNIKILKIVRIFLQDCKNIKEFLKLTKNIYIEHTCNLIVNVGSLKSFYDQEQDNNTQSYCFYLSLTWKF